MRHASTHSIGCRPQPDPPDDSPVDRGDGTGPPILPAQHGARRMPLRRPTTPP